MQILTTQALLGKYKNYANPADKIKRESDKQNLILLKKRLYVDDKNLEGALLAQFIYGPSYLSFEYALYYYDMIHERINHNYTSATFSKEKERHIKIILALIFIKMTLKKLLMLVLI